MDRVRRLALGPASGVAKSVLNVLIALTASVWLLLSVPTHVATRTTKAPSSTAIFLTLAVLVLFRLALSRWLMLKIWRESDGSMPPTAQPQAGLEDEDKRAFRNRFAKPEDVGVQLATAVLDPKRYIARVNEEVTLQDSKYRIKLLRELVFAESDPRTVLIPVLIPKKGTLIASLSVRADSGHAWVLPHHETQGALLAAGQGLVELSRLGAEDQEAAYIQYRSAVYRTRLDRAADHELRLNHLITRLTQDSSDKHANALAGLLATCDQSYYIVAVIDRGDAQSTTLECEYVIPAQTHTEKIRGMFRTALGLGMRQHAFRLGHADSGLSYHWNAEMPAGLYVFDVSVTRMIAKGHGIASVGTGPESPRGTNTSLTTESVLVPSPTKGLDYVHVYARDLFAQVVPTSERWQYFLNLELRERPPGLLAIVFLLNMYLTALVWGVGHYHDLVFRTTPAYSSWPTILFGIPALISGWLVSRFTPDGDQVGKLRNSWTHRVDRCQRVLGRDHRRPEDVSGTATSDQRARCRGDTADVDTGDALHRRSPHPVPRGPIGADAALPH
jgi:hypothetical protein